MMVAIDAVPFRSKKAENQYRQSYILRELNKALVGFYCVEMRGDSMVDSVNDVRKVLKASGSPVDYLRHNSIYPEWKIGCDVTDNGITGIADDISDFASLVVNDVIASVTNDELSQFASSVVADVVTQAVQATSTASGGDEISQFASNVVDTIVDSVLNGRPSPNKGTGMAIDEILDTQAKVDSPQYQTYAEELTTVIISNVLQSISQDGNVDDAKTVPSSFNEQLNLRLQGLAAGRQSPSKGSIKPAAVRTPSGWSDCLMGLHLSANSRKTNSMIWSSAATVNEGSDPPSPSELASLCLDEADDGISEFATDLSSVIVAEVIGGIANSTSDVRFSIGAPTLTVSLQGAVTGEDFLDGSTSVLDHFAPKWSNKHFNLLRPVVTSNWGGGAHNGDVQLKSLLQWMAISATGRPLMIYYTNGNQSMKEVCHQLNSVGIVLIFCYTCT